VDTYISGGAVKKAVNIVVVSERSNANCSGIEKDVTTRLNQL
jgi:hypothetical protein